MDTVTLSRAFFGSSLAFHIIFATLGIGLSLMIFISEVLYHWRKDSDAPTYCERREAPAPRIVRRDPASVQRRRSTSPT